MGTKMYWRNRPEITISGLPEDVNFIKISTKDGMKDYSKCGFTVDKDGEVKYIFRADQPVEEEA